MTENSIINELISQINSELLTLDSALTTDEIANIDAYAGSTLGIVPLRIAATLARLGDDSTTIKNDLTSIFDLTSSFTPASFIALRGSTFAGIELLGSQTAGATSIDKEFATINAAIEVAIGNTPLSFYSPTTITNNILTGLNSVSTSNDLATLIVNSVGAVNPSLTIAELTNDISANINQPNACGVEYPTSISAIVKQLNTTLSYILETAPTASALTNVILAINGNFNTYPYNQVAPPICITSSTDSNDLIADINSVAAPSISQAIGSTSLIGINLLGEKTLAPKSLSAALNAVANAIGSIAVSTSILAESAPANNLSDAIINIQNAIGDTTLLGAPGMNIATAIGSAAVSTSILAESAPGNSLSDAIINIQNAIGDTALLGVSGINIANAIGSTAVSTSVIGRTAPANNLSGALLNVQYAIGPYGLLGAPGMNIATAIGNVAVDRPILAESAPDNSLSDAIINIQNAIGSTHLLGVSGMNIANAIGSTSVNIAILGGSAPGNNLSAALANVQKEIGNTPIQSGPLSYAVNQLQEDIAIPTNFDVWSNPNDSSGDSNPTSTPFSTHSVTICNANDNGEVTQYSNFLYGIKGTTADAAYLLSAVVQCSAWAHSGQSLNDHVIYYALDGASTCSSSETMHYGGDFFAFCMWAVYH